MFATEQYFLHNTYIDNKHQVYRDWFIYFDNKVYNKLHLLVMKVILESL